MHSKIEFSFCDTRPSKYVFLHSHARNTQRQVLLCVTQTNLKKKVISLQNLQALHLQAGRFRITSWYVYTWASTFALYETLYMVFTTSRFCTLLLLNCSLSLFWLKRGEVSETRMHFYTAIKFLFYIHFANLYIYTFQCPSLLHYILETRFKISWFQHSTNLTGRTYIINTLFLI